MNRIGTGARVSKTITLFSFNRTDIENNSITVSAWTQLGSIYTASVTLSPSKRGNTVRNPVKIESLLYNHDLVSKTHECSIMTLHGDITAWVSVSFEPTENLTLQITYSYEDVQIDLQTVNDSYTHVMLGNEVFNPCSPLLPTIESNDVVVTLTSSTSFDIRVSNPLSYNVEIIGASITVDDSDQTTLTFGLSDLSETLISSEDQGTTVFSVDLDDYTGNDISGYSITLEIGGTGRQTLTFREDM